MLYEIIIRVQVSAHGYTVRELVQADSADAAQRFARHYAAGLYPDARYDHELDIYSGAHDAQWCIERVAPVECLYAHGARADGRNGRATPVALLPWQDAQDALTLATRTMRALVERPALETMAEFKARLGVDDLVLELESARLERVLDARAQRGATGKQEAR